MASQLQALVTAASNGKDKVGCARQDTHIRIVTLIAKSICTRSSNHHQGQGPTRFPFNLQAKQLKALTSLHQELQRPAR
jgi:hypothetical protein